jgi:hypothetical protein
MISYYLCLGLLSGLFPSGFPHQNPVYISYLLILATYSAHLIILGLITRMILGEQYRFLCFYHSAFRSTFAVPSMVVFYISSISCFPALLFKYFPNDIRMVSVCIIITGIIYFLTNRLLLLCLLSQAYFSWQFS